MKQPNQAERTRPGADDARTRRPPQRRSPVDRLRPFAPWAIVALTIAAAYAADLPNGDWRSPRDALMAVDPRALLPLPALGWEPLPAAMGRWALSAVFGALVGVFVWVRQGPVPGAGFFAACRAGSLIAVIEILRLFKPGQVPDFRDAIIAFLTAPLAWQLMRLLPVQPRTAVPKFGPWGARRRIFFRFLFGGLVILGAGAAALALPAAAELGLTPSRVAAAIARLPDDRTGPALVVTKAIVTAVETTGLGSWLRSADAIERPTDMSYPAWIGDRREPEEATAMSRARPVATIDQLRQAIDTAMPGDVILLQPGTYRIRGSYISIVRPGSLPAPIVVRAARPGTVTIESELDEALKVAAPHWRFENLYLRGVCADDSACDNGFHIVGAAEFTAIRNMRIEDFNAHIKINGENGKFPDHGEIVRTSMIGTHIRKTEASVTPIDLVAASFWTIEENLIADFLKSGGNKVSYGAFAKGEGRGNVFRRNVILCEWHLRAAGTESIGLSFGGGGTIQELRRAQGITGYEHADGVISDNLIAFCSDDGIYLNRAANTLVRHNTLIATTGIDARYPETTARIEGNVVD